MPDAPTRILEPGRNCWRLERTHRLAVLVDGAAYFDAFVAACRAAQESVLILGWDIDSRVLLQRGEGAPGPGEAEAGTAGPRLGAFLDGLAAERPELRVYILAWDFAMIYALEREALPLFKLGWQTHPNVHFQLDGEHPLAGSQHQKIVVVDDRVAFCGGLDLTKVRWDTPAHAPDDPRRRDPAGQPYGPFHDVQVMVDGPAAAALGDLARERWRFATGQALPGPASAQPEPGAGADRWPPAVEPHLVDVPVGIARTLPAFKGRPEAREVEQLYLDGIAAARETLYLENQYFSSNAVREALAARLREPDGPEVAIVLPSRSSGWLEEAAMDALRDLQLRSLREADEHGRLGVWFPSNEAGPKRGAIKVHAKLMAVDDRLFLAGSANLSNRSMGLDSECDLAVEAGPDDGAVREAIAGLRDRLLAEHLGCDAETVARHIQEQRSVLRAVKALRKDGARSLHPLRTDAEPWVPETPDGEPLLDLERPVALDRLMDDLLHQEPPDEPGRLQRWWRVGLLALAMLGLLALWRWTPVGQAVDADTLGRWAVQMERSPVTLLWVLAAYVAGAFLLFPVTLLIGVTAAMFSPLTAFAYAVLGSLAAACATYWVGHWLGRGTVRRVAGSRLNRLSRHLAERGLVAVLIVRLLPVAPFTVVNLVAGASHIRFRHYLLGSLLGMLPGILGVTVLVDRTRSALVVPTPTNIAVLAAVALVIGVGGTWLARRLTRKVRGHLHRDRQEGGAPAEDEAAPARAQRGADSATEAGG